MYSTRAFFSLLQMFLWTFLEGLWNGKGVAQCGVGSGTESGMWCGRRTPFFTEHFWWLLLRIFFSKNICSQRLMNLLMTQLQNSFDKIRNLCLEIIDKVIGYLSINFLENKLHQFQKFLLKYFSHEK